MKRVLCGLTLVLSFATQALGAVDPNAPTPAPQVQAVLGECELVASTQKAQGNPNAGRCLGSTQTFLDGLKAETPSLSSDDFDKQIAALVVALAPLAQKEPTCDAVDSEIAQAIKLASGYSHTDQQKAQLLQISQTVATCQFGATNAIDIPAEVTPSPVG
jgi:hypothetical protein